MGLWNRPPYLVSSEGGTKGNAILFFNLRKIRASLLHNPTTFTFKIATPASVPITTSGVEYWVWSNAFGASSLEENEAHPFTTGDPRFPPFGIITIPTASARPEDAAAFAAMFVAPEMLRHVPAIFRIRIPTASAGSFRLAPYRKRTDFPTQSDNSPDWNVEEAIKGHDESATLSEIPVPAYLVTVDVNIRTLSVTSSKA